VHFDACTAYNVFMLGLLTETKRRLILSLFAFGLMLRVVIPAGLMPSAVGDGWPLKICPDGISVELMVELFGDAHAHHKAEGDANFAQCEFSSGLSAQDLSFNSLILPPGLAEQALIELSQVSTLQYQLWRYFRSRAPPTAFLP